MAGRFANLLGTVLSTFGIGPAGSRATLVASGLSANRTATLPNKSGTLAMLDDAAGGYVGSRTITGATDTVTAADVNHLLRCQNTAALTITLDSTGLAALQSGDVLQEAAAAVTLHPGAGMTFVPAGDQAIRTQGAGASWIYLGADTFWIIGDLASGASGSNTPIRVIAGTSDTPTSTSAGHELDCTNAGTTTITLDPAGFSAGDWFNVLRADGPVTFAAAGGGSILGGATPTLPRAGAMASVLYRGSNSFVVVGEITAPPLTPPEVMARSFLRC